MDRLAAVLGSFWLVPGFSKYTEEILNVKLNFLWSVSVSKFENNRTILNNFSPNTSSQNSGRYFSGVKKVAVFMMLSISI